MSLPEDAINYALMNTLFAYISDAQHVVDWFHKVRGITIVKAESVAHISELLQRSTFEIVVIDPLFLNQLKPEDFAIIADAKVILLGSKSAVVSHSSLKIIDQCPKPIQFHRLLKALTKVFKVRGGESIVRSDQDHLLIKTDGVIIQLSLDEICCVESMRDYILFHSKDHRFVVHSTLKNVQNLIKDTPSFIQIHRSIVVNSDKIHEKTTNSVMVCQQNYPVSRTNRHKLKYVMLG
ncbi:MAG: DNA-binding LytR/AlgR family response regulator [Flavobacteriales bacterium]